MSIKSIPDLFGVWGSIGELADAVDEHYWTVQKWWQRKRIPSDSWASVIEAARTKGHDLTTDDMLILHSAPIPRRAPKRAAAGK